MDWEDINRSKDNPGSMSVMGSLGDRDHRTDNRLFHHREEDFNDHRFLIDGMSPRNAPSSTRKACKSSSPSLFSENVKIESMQNGSSMEAGFLDCEWDDFDDFKFFRGDTGSADDFPWFSPPSMTEGRRFNYDHDSSNSEFNGANHPSKVDESDMTFLLEDKPLYDVFGRSSFANYPDSIWIHAPAENNFPLNSKNIRRPSEERKKKRSKNLTLNTLSAQFLETESSQFSSRSIQTYGSLTDKKDSFVSAKPLDNQVKVEDSHQSQDHAHVPTSGGEPEVRSNAYPFYGQAAEQLGDDSSRNVPTANCLTEKTSEKMQALTCHYEDYNPFSMENKSQACTNVQTRDAELGREGSKVSVFETDQSFCLESFMKIQDILDQLDSPTRLCMRDGLYRLAKSAELRGTCSSSGIPFGNESVPISERILETGTNAIDRSIAQLLFYRSLD
ncbi:uncharacterized protein LOC144701773 isoform X2 [Wolffia australiana]